MTSMQRPISGDVMVFGLHEERRNAEDPAILARTGRTARTLLRNGTLRVTLIVLAPGAELPEHSAPGPITIQPLEGRIRFTAAGETRDLVTGQLLSAAPGVRHSVYSQDGATFLLSVVHEVPLTQPAEMAP